MRRAAPRAVVFDFDGTLADSFPWFLREFNGVARRFRFRGIAPHEVEGLRQRSAAEIVRHVGCARWKLPFVAMHLRRRMARQADIRCFDGVPQLLAGLHARGLTLVLLSSNSEHNVRRILGPAACAQLSHFVCGVSLFGKRAGLRRALRLAGASPAEAVSIGDEIRDAHAARAEGVPFIGVGWGYTAPQALQPHASHGVVARVGDLLAVL